MSFGNDDQRGPKLPDNMKSVALVPFVNYIFSNLLEMLTLSVLCAQAFLQRGHVPEVPHCA